MLCLILLIPFFKVSTHFFYIARLIIFDSIDMWHTIVWSYLIIKRMHCFIKKLFSNPSCISRA